MKKKEVIQYLRNKASVYRKKYSDTLDMDYSIATSCLENAIIALKETR